MSCFRFPPSRAPSKSAGEMNGLKTLNMRYWDELSVARPSSACLTTYQLLLCNNRIFFKVWNKLSCWSYKTLHKAARAQIKTDSINGSLVIIWPSVRFIKYLLFAQILVLVPVRWRILFTGSFKSILLILSCNLAGET